MAKLVAYYSRADENYFGGKMQVITVGNTEKVARLIANLVHADLFKIEQKKPYSADYNTCIAEAKEDKKNNIRPELINLIDNIDEYDERKFILSAHMRAVDFQVRKTILKMLHAAQM